MSWLVVLCLPLGLALVGCSAFLYESEERRIEQALSEWWIGLDDLRAKTTSRILAFAKRISMSIVAWLDHLFGVRLLSVHAAAVSVWLSFASFFLFGAVAFIVKPENNSVLIVSIAFTISGICFFVATTNRRLVSRWRDVGALAITLLMAGWFLYAETVGMVAAMCVGVLFGILADLLVVMLTRWSAQVVIATGRALFTVGIVIVNALVAFLVLIAPIQYATAHYDSHFMRDTLYFWATSNLFAGIIASSFVLLPLTLLFQHLAWPFASRTLYALHRFRVLQNRKVLFFAGTALIAVGVPQLAIAIKEIMEVLKL